MSADRATTPDGGHIAYDLRGPVTGRAGRGPVLLLLRPLGGSMALWGRFRDELAELFRVVSFDPRGTGLSSAVLPGTGTREMADDAVCLLDHLAIDGAHVFGLSLGGMVASWLAARAPRRVRRLVLASTPARGLDLSGAGALRGLGFVRCLLGRADAVEPCLARRVLSPRFRRQEPARVQWIEATARRQPARRRDLLRLTAAGLRHDARAVLGEIRAPTLVLSGGCDAILPGATQRAMASRIAGARWELVAAAGHDLSLEAPVETAARVSAFLSED